MNPYEILGVKIDASIDEIKSAYLKLAKKYHPDISKEKNALQMMTKINQAYDILTKPQPIRRPPAQSYQQPVVIIFTYGFGGTTANGYYGGSGGTGFY
jgi:molecular chaperone DnaJ